MATRRTIKGALLERAALVFLVSSMLAAPAGAQEAVESEESSIEFLKEQLARSRAAAAGRAESPSDTLDEESARLLAEESALLNQLASPKAAESEANAAPNTSEAEAARASADIQRALNELEATSGTGVAPIQEAPGIEVVREEPARRIVRLPRAETPREVKSEEPSKETESLRAQAKQNSQTIAALQRTNADLRRQLEAAQKRLRESTQALDESRNRLLIAETEVERLSNVIEQRNRSSLARVTGGADNILAKGSAEREYKVPAASVANSTSRAPLATEAAKVTKTDMLIATVTVSKAHLRTAPGKNNSPLMTVSKGTRLAVETRHGDWYRVITPTGTRAWISAEVVSFGPGRSASPTRTVKTAGYAKDSAK